MVSKKKLRRKKIKNDCYFNSINRKLEIYIYMLIQRNQSSSSYFLNDSDDDILDYFLICFLTFYSIFRKSYSDISYITNTITICMYITKCVTVFFLFRLNYIFSCSSFSGLFMGDYYSASKLISFYFSKYLISFSISFSQQT